MRIKADEAARQATTAAHQEATARQATTAAQSQMAESVEAVGGVESAEGVAGAAQPTQESSANNDSAGGFTEGSAARRKLSTRQKVGATVVGVLSCVLIAVSAFFLVSPAAVDGQAALQTVTSTSRDASSQQAHEATDANGAESAQSEESDAKDGASTSVSDEAGGEGAGADSAALAAGDVGASTGDAAASQSGSSADSGTASSGASSGSSGSTSGSNGSAGTQQSATVTVSVSVSSSAADGRVSGGANPTFSYGATAYDALMATGLAVNASSSQYGVYVSAIGGLAEKEFGGRSGWMYSVNGVAPSVSCSSYILQNGDTVSWYYVTG